MADLTEAGRDLREHFDIAIPPLEQVRRRATRSHRRRIAAAGAAVSIPLLGVATIVGLMHGSQGSTKVVAGEPSVSGVGAIVLRPVDCDLPPAYPAAMSRAVTAAVCATSPAAIPTLPPGTGSASSTVILPALGTSTLFLLGPPDDIVGPSSPVRVVPASSGGFDVRIELPRPLTATLLPDIESPYSSLPQAAPATTRQEAIVAQGAVVGLIELPFNSQRTGVLDAGAPIGGPFSRQAADELVRLIEGHGAQR